MLTFIDISNWQKGIDIPSALSSVDAIVCKATEGLTYVDGTCDGYIQKCKAAGKPYGFYHFGRNNDATKEAEYFYTNCKGYFNDGIPVLDWEADQSVSWVNTFVRKIHDLTDVWPWIYANPWRFNQSGVESNCARWVASYPDVSHPTFATAKGWDWPTADGNVVAWQFCSDGRISGYSGNLDCNLYCGDKESWCKYAGSSGSTDSVRDNDGDSASSNDTTLENGEYKITIVRK